MRQQWTSEAEAAILALQGIGWKVSTIAVALGRSVPSVRARIWSLGCRGIRPKRERIRAQDSAIEGETWVDLSARGVSVSSEGRLKAIKSGHLLHPSRNPKGELYITVDLPKRTTCLVGRLISEARGDPQPANRRIAWSPEEDRLLRSSNTLAEAEARLDRTTYGIKGRARKLKVRFSRDTPKGQVVGGSVPWGEPLWEDANRLVPTWYPQHVREDLVQEIVSLRLMDPGISLATAFKMAKAEMNRQSNPWRDRSLDAPLSITDNRHLIDLLAAE